MALETKYRPTYAGSFLQSDGTLTNELSEAVEFDTVEEVEAFVSGSGPLGEYHIRRYLIKS